MTYIILVLLCLTLLFIGRVLALVVLRVEFVQTLLIDKLNGTELAGIVRLCLGQFVEHIVIPVDL